VRAAALLAESRVPELGNRLATALDLPAGDGPVLRAFRDEAAPRIAALDTRRVVPYDLSHPLIALAVAAAAGAVLLAAVGAETIAQRWLRPGDAPGASAREGAAARPPVAVSDPVPGSAGFGPLRWRIEPPRYAGLPAREYRGEALPAVLPGSRVELRSRLGRGWSAVSAERVGGGRLPVDRRGGEWSLA
jgi:hypothetical protein